MQQPTTPLSIAISKQSISTTKDFLSITDVRVHLVQKTSKLRLLHVCPIADNADEMEWFICPELYSYSEDYITEYATLLQEGDRYLIQQLFVRHMFGVISSRAMLETFFPDADTVLPFLKLRRNILDTYEHAFIVKRTSEHFGHGHYTNTLYLPMFFAGNFEELMFEFSKDNMIDHKLIPQYKQYKKISYIDSF
jgi:hypothetical protein